MAALKILVDADACPVKEEVYKVALRHGVAVTVVANMALRIPEASRVFRRLLFVRRSHDERYKEQVFT